MTNIVLIGLRGSGKSKLGRKLAAKMKRKFIDTDKEIEKQERMPTSRIINKKGWNYFRKIEKYVVRRVSKETNCVISTGGGAVIDKENAKHLAKNGFLVYLKLSTEQLSNRLQDDQTRPPLTESENLSDEIEQVRSKREPIYLELANLVFEPVTDTEDIKKDLKLNIINLNAALGQSRDEFKKPD